MLPRPENSVLIELLLNTAEKFGASSHHMRHFPIHQSVKLMEENIKYFFKDLEILTFKQQLEILISIYAHACKNLVFHRLFMPRNLIIEASMIFCYARGY